MKICLRKKISKNIYDLIRYCGYQWVGKKKDNWISAIRRIGQSNYPRFHLFIKKNEGEISLSLHLDQKRPVYRGSIAHSGEYNSHLVKEELERVKNILKSL